MSASPLTGSHLLAHALKEEGVTTVFTIAGDHTLPLMDVMAGMGFRFIDTRHEQAASFMADAWGRVTGGLGVVMATTPGVANAIPGLANALHSESPVLSIGGSAEVSELGKGANQEIDQVALAKAVTKGSWLVHDARRIPDLVAGAVRAAYAGRRGPTHLTVPLDVQEQPVEEGQAPPYHPVMSNHVGNAALADAGQVKLAVDLLSRAERPLIIAAASAGYGGDGSWLERFIETTKIPVMTADLARGIVSDEHPYCLGFFDTALNWAAKLVGQADAVLLLGKKLDNSIRYGEIFDPGARIIQIDPEATEIGRNRRVDAGMAGDVAAIVDQLSDEASKRRWRELPWLRELRAQREAQAEWFETVAAPSTPIHAAFVHKTLKSLLRPDDILVWDGGDFGHFGRMTLPARSPRRWFYFSQFGTLGNGLPTALAAQVAHPDSRVVLLAGDGGFGFTAMEFDTAVRHNLPVTAILGNDATWGIDYHIQMGLYGRDTATRLLPTRYDRVVEGLGGHGERVTRPEELAPALKRALDSGRPSLVNVEIQNAISPRAEAAIGRWLERRDQHPSPKE